jgi:hypothetical protein
MNLLAPFSGCTPSTAPPQTPPDTTLTEPERKPAVTVVAPQEKHKPTGKEIVLKYYSDRVDIGKLTRAAQKGREAGLPSDWHTFEAAIDVWNQLSLGEVMQLLSQAANNSD